MAMKNGIGNNERQWRNRNNGNNQWHQNVSVMASMAIMA
jgi:hypothetical protein